jgi:hypothetical protein
VNNKCEIVFNNENVIGDKKSRPIKESNLFRYFYLFHSVHVITEENKSGMEQEMGAETDKETN